MKRRLLLALPVLLLATLVLLLGSNPGSRWLLERIPGVAVDGFSGRLGGDWQAERLVWSADGQTVELRQPRLAWSALCLLRLRLCLHEVEAHSVSLEFPGGAEDTAEEQAAPRLPALRLPLAIELERLRIGALSLNGERLLDSASLRARWLADGMHLEQAEALRDAMLLTLHGELRPEAEWPLRLQASLELPPMDGHDWRLALEVDGELQQKLALTAHSEGYLEARLEAGLWPLHDNLPAEAQLRIEAFRVDQNLSVEQGVLNASGNLGEGYRIAVDASLPASAGALALRLRGLLDAAGANIDSLSLSASENQRAELKGRLDWHDGLSADASLDWQDLPWQRLYPLELPVSLRRLQAEVQYRDGGYLGNFDAALDGPAGAFTFSSPLSGDLGQVHLPALRLGAGKGRLEGRLGLQFADGLGWDADLALADLDPAYWLQELPGKLAGRLRSQGGLRDERLQASADLDLTGRLRGEALALRVQGRGEDRQWQLDTLQLSLGSNRIQGQGSLEERLQGELRLSLSRLGQLWPGLQGSLDGTLDLAGTLQAPQARLALQGRQLAFDEQRLASLRLNANLDARQQGRLDLLASGIRSGDNDFGELSVQGRGDIREQHLQLALEGPLLHTQLEFAGQLREGDWRGQLRRGEIASGGQEWRLRQPARLDYLSDGRLNLGRHCWVSGPASLCGEDMRLIPEPRLRYRLRDFPLASLQPWLPQDFAWDGELSVDLALDLPAGGPSGRIEVDAGSGVLRVREGERWLDFPYERLSLQTTLRPRDIDSRLQFQGGALGQLFAAVRLDPLPASKPLSGEFRLSGLDLAVARPFLPQVEQLAGRLQGRGSLSGSLLAPHVNGELSLREGHIDGAQLPLSFEQLDLQARIDGARLQLQGAWRSGEQGRGSVQGQVDWGHGLNGEVRLLGEKLPASIEPYARLEVEPDLRLRLGEEGLAISGRVRVPRGAIEVRELPASTVQLSEDALVVGDEPQEESLKMAMDITVEVGGDKLTFKGFGLSAELAGRLKIGNDLDTRGELALNKGRYSAYGQRLTIRRARLLFAGPLDQPFLDIEAVRNIDKVIAGIRITGSAAQPRTQVFAEPAMSEEQALSYLVLGRPLGGTGEDSNLLAQAALGLGLAGSASLTGSLAQRLGISDFQLDASGSGLTTSVVVSGRLSERLSLRYGVGVFEPANTVALRYDLTRRLYLEAASGLASSLDLFYKRDF